MRNLEAEVAALRAELHQARQDVMYARGERDALRHLVGARLARSPEVAERIDAAVEREVGRMVETVHLARH